MLTKLKLTKIDIETYDYGRVVGPLEESLLSTLYILTREL